VKKPHRRSQPKSEQDGQAGEPANSLQKIETFLEALPPEEREEYRAVAVETFFSGPLPPPSLFRRYDEALPGAAERILAMAEKEQDHRHEWERKALQGEIGYSRLGLWLGAMALVLDLAAVVYVAANGQEWSASILAAIGIAGIIGAVIKGRRFSHDKNDSQAKR
jgi:uncharacterized membrane protein